MDGLFASLLSLFLVLLGLAVVGVVWLLIGNMLFVIFAAMFIGALALNYLANTYWPRDDGELWDP